MINDHRPYWLKQAFGIFENWYVEWRVSPRFQSLGPGYMIMKPWNVRIYGDHIAIGDNVHIITTSDRKVSFSSWSYQDHQGHITLGNNVLVCPGVRFDSASQMTIGNNCMFAAGAYITDADWHDVYDRTQTIGKTLPVTLEDNVWIGDGSIVCKGVTIGENTVIGAGSVVASDIPANSIAAGNPAKVIKPLDPERELITRASLLEDSAALDEEMDKLERYLLGSNTFLDWLRSVVLPRRGD